MISVIHVLVFAVASILSSAKSLPPVSRHISISVHVQAEGGDPLAGLVLDSSMSAETSAGKSDAKGDCVISGDVDETTTSVIVYLEKGSTSEITTVKREDMIRFSQICRDYSFRQYYRVALQPGVSKYSLTMTGGLAFRVTGRFTDGNGGTLKTSMWRLDSPLFVECGYDGVFDIGGFQRQSESAFEVMVPKDLSHRILWVRSAPNAADVDLHDVVLKPVARDVTVDMILTNRAALVNELCPKQLFASFVSVSGDAAYCFMVNDEGRVVPMIGSTLLQIPAGTYYVVPGPVQPNRSAAKLISALHANKQRDLDVAHVVKATAVTGQTLTMTVDAAAAETAILSVTGTD